MKKFLFIFYTFEISILNLVGCFSSEIVLKKSPVFPELLHQKKYFVVIFVGKISLFLVLGFLMAFWRFYKSFLCLKFLIISF